MAGDDISTVGDSQDETRDALGPMAPGNQRPRPPAGRAGPDSETTIGLPPAEGGSIELPERYRDMRLLGSGGFGEVRRVFDTRLEQVVAIKMLRPDIAEVPKLRSRFLAEVKLTAGLHHPGIIAIHDYGELSDGRLWFTMPEVRGRTLLAVIREAFGSGGAASTPDTAVQRRRLLDLFARVCDAMAYAHSRGVIHRDLKPENIMVGEFGEVMVMDWGIARRTRRWAEEGDEERSQPPSSEEISIDGLTRHGDIMGTPAYMPPEQALGQLHRLGPTSDVYALGGTLFYLLAGRPPFSGTSADVWKRLLTEGPPPLTDPDIPADLVAICSRAMARYPEDRYPDARQLGADIDAFLTGARRREQALEKLAEAQACTPRIATARDQAAKLRARAATLLAQVKPSDPVTTKMPGWEMEDEADRLERQAALDETHLD